MNERVEGEEDPQRAGRETGADEHGRPSSAVVVRLKSRHGFPLEDENDAVEDFPELAVVEQDDEGRKRVWVVGWHSAESVGETGDATFANTVEQIGYHVADCVDEGPGRVDGQRGVVRKDEVAQSSTRLDVVLWWWSTAGLVLLGEARVAHVGRHRHDEVEDADDDRHPAIERQLKEPLRHGQRLWVDWQWLQGHLGQDAQAGQVKWVVLHDDR